MLFRKIIETKIKQLSKGELLYYADQYHFILRDNEANQIIRLLHENDINMFSKKERDELFIKLTEITDEYRAKRAYLLFKQLIRNHHLEHYFDEL